MLRLAKVIVKNKLLRFYGSLCIYDFAADLTGIGNRSVREIS